MLSGKGKPEHGGGGKHIFFSFHISVRAGTEKQIEKRLLKVMRLTLKKLLNSHFLKWLT